MPDAESLAAMLCDEILSLEAEERMTMTHRVAIYLMEFIAYDVTRNVAGCRGTTLFMMASEYDLYLRQVGAAAKDDRTVIQFPQLLGDKHHQK